MKNLSIEYPFEIHPVSKDEGGGYAIVFPDLPGCRSDGATTEEAIENGHDAIKSWLAVAREFDDPLPKTFTANSAATTRKRPAR